MILTAGLGALSAIPLGAQEKPSKPNILIIIADDLGWMDLGFMGSEYYESPNLDRLAAEGVRFTNGYAACQVSSPSRASILTGKTPARHGITAYIGDKYGASWTRNTPLRPAEYAQSLALEETTLAEKLREAGYITFMAGKWHLGGKGSYPEDHGFDINIGGYERGNPAGGYFPPYKNPKLSDGPAGENLSERLARETASFLEQRTRANDGRPFFAYLSFYAIHGPIETTRERWKHFRDKALERGVADTAFVFDRRLPVRLTQDNPVYAGLVQQMDDAAGLVLSKLTELGLDENTIVIFTSDNGGVASGNGSSSSMLPLRGGKGRQWEGGLRVPFVIRYPGCPAGSTCTEPVIGMDIYPTILDFAEIGQVPEQHIDGVSLMPLLSGTEKSFNRALYWHFPHYSNQGGEPSTVVRDGDWKLIYYHEDGRYELYNLTQDLAETSQLNDRYPEKLAALRAKLTKWMDEVRAKMPEVNPSYDPVKFSEEMEYQQTVKLEELEAKRRRMLEAGWQPNKDWWGSIPQTED